MKHLSGAKTDCSQINLKKRPPNFPQMFLGVGKYDLNVEAGTSESFATVILSVKKLFFAHVISV